MSERRQFCTFWLEDLLCGIDVAAVQEVLQPQTTRRVPLAADSIKGLINLRGQVVTAIDLRSCLAMPPRTDDRGAVNIIIRSAQEPVSLLVDRIGDILEVDESAFEPPPQTLRGIAADLIVGMYRLEHRLLIALSARHVVDRAMTVRKGKNGQAE